MAFELSACQPMLRCYTVLRLSKSERRVNATGTAELYRTPVGKKLIMAASGVVLLGFVIGHMLGNLQVYLGAEALDAYARKLREFPLLLWTARAVLLFCVMAHIVSATQLALLNKRARPKGYAQRKYIAATYASRTMYWSGPILLAFIIYHLMHLTWGNAHPDFEHLAVYRNVVLGFSNWTVSGFYIFAQLLLGMHLFHGIWSMFQTLGLSNERWEGRLRRLAALVSLSVVVGNISIPAAVLAGWVTL